jgi:hypothetical protein
MKGHASGNGIKSLALEDAEREIIGFGDRCIGVPMIIILLSYSMHPQYRVISKGAKLFTQMPVFNEDDIGEVYAGLVVHNFCKKKL